MIKLYCKIFLLLLSLWAFSAQAQVAALTFETNPALIGAAAATAGSTASLTSLEIAKKVFTASLELLKKRLLDMVVDQTVNWIQGNGEPLFITDWQLFFAQSANIASADLIRELGLGSLCRPFGVQLQLAVMQPPRFSRSISCTLDKIIGNALNFYEDFRSGGFIAYREMWQPQNNFYGAVLMALEEKESRVASAVFASTQEALAGNGILGTKRCYPKPGAFVVDGVPFEVQAKRNPWDFYCFITTPGSQVGALVAKAIGSDIDYIINSQDLAAYVAAISDALINRLVREGVNGLRGVLTTNLPSSSGYIDSQYSGQQPCSGLRGDTLRDCQNFIGYKSGDFNDLQKVYLEQINLTLLPMQAAEKNVQESINSQRSLVNKLSELKFCQINRNVAGKEATQTELDAEQKKLDKFVADLISIQDISIPLLNAKLHLQNPPTKDSHDLTAAFNEIRNLLNPTRANEIKLASEKDMNDNKTAVSQRLPQVQQSITTCASS